MVDVLHNFREIFPLFKQFFGYLQFFATFFSIDCLGATDPTDFTEAAFKAGKNGRLKCHTSCKFGAAVDHALLDCFDSLLRRFQSA